MGAKLGGGTVSYEMSSDTYTDSFSNYMTSGSYSATHRASNYMQMLQNNASVRQQEMLLRQQESALRQQQANLQQRANLQAQDVYGLQILREANMKLDRTVAEYATLLERERRARKAERAAMQIEIDALKAQLEQARAYPPRPPAPKPYVSPFFDYPPRKPKWSFQWPLKKTMIR